MTEFPNFGLMNQMSKHIANNASPKILDYQMNGNNGYIFSPTSTDLMTSYTPSNNSISQQQRFNAIADQLLYNNTLFNENKQNDTNSSYNQNSNQVAVQQRSIIDSLINPQQQVVYSNNTQSLPKLNNKVEQGIIYDNASVPKERFTNNDGIMRIEPENRLNIIGVVIIGLILFMLIQLYLTQKKLEFMLSMYSNNVSQPYMRQQNNNNNNGPNDFSKNEIF